MTGAGLPPLNWLRAFEASARHLSFTAAAEELNLTQSAVSQHIRSLEQFLGCALFIRRTRALQLTEAGFNYLPTVREAFDILAIGTRALTGGDRGRSLMVQSNMAFTTFWLAPRMAPLLEANPWLTLHIVTPIWEPERTAPDAEIEIRFGRESEMSDAVVRLTREQCFPVCRPGFAEGAADWRKHALFDCAGVIGNWETWLADQGDRLPKGKLVNLASTYVISLTAVLNGAGLAMAHGTLASTHLSQGNLVAPFDHLVDMPEAYFLRRPAKHDETPASRTFAEWIEGAFA